MIFLTCPNVLLSTKIFTKKTKMIYFLLNSYRLNTGVPVVKVQHAGK